ncbi:MAG: flavodoxin [Clostridia bacterium]|nr:flavodoxin [Clostridia bacterium]
MKKLLILVLTMILAMGMLSFAAADSAQAQGETGRTLVVFYSSTGTTEGIANIIAQTLEADVLRLIPVVPYTSEDLVWSNENSRTAREWANPETRVVELEANTVENWDEYDTVFIGYPLWWGIAAWPVNNFMEANDFTGKTVIPFCTSGSSGFGQSGALLEEMAGTGEWVEGRRFSASSSEDAVIEWLGDLGLM